MAGSDRGQRAWRWSCTKFLVGEEPASSQSTLERQAREFDGQREFTQGLPCGVLSLDVLLDRWGEETQDEG